MFFLKDSGKFHPYTDLPFVILSGVGRSGTTVLRKSLGIHPQIIYNGDENNIIHDILKCALHNCSIPSRKGAMQVSKKKYNNLFKQLILNLLYPKAKKTSTTKIILAFSNLDINLSEYFLELFPNGKIIYLVRNGIEVTASRILFGSFKSNSFLSHLYKWQKSKHMVEWGINHPQFFFLMRHEFFINKEDASKQLAELWKFLNISPNPNPLKNILTKLYHPTNTLSENNRSNDQLSKRQDRWHTWTQEQKHQFITHCKEAMDYFEYKIPN